MSRLKQWVLGLTGHWDPRPVPEVHPVQPAAPGRKRGARSRSRPYFFIEGNDFCPEFVEYKPEDTELAVINSLGELGSSIGTTGSFIALASQCHRCERMFRAINEASIDATSHFSAGALKDSAISCEFCFVLLQGIARHCYLNPYAQFTATVDKKHGHVIIRAPIKRIRFQSCDYIPSPWPYLGSGDEIAVPNSMQCFQRIKQWISACVSGHQCGGNVPEGAAWLPTRVIDVGTSRNSVRLLEPPRAGAVSGRYLCLSHCWGDRQPLVTKTNNIHRHLAGLEWDALPKTYQDTICVARLLGIAYVWIDSLCIVQDDDDDWVRESKAMADIYENAFITIAAASSRNPAGGLFTQRRPTQELIVGRRYGAGGAPYVVAAVDDIQHPKVTDSPQALLNNWPLWTRGWVLQERLLSPKVIHFAYPEMIWECRETSLCECGQLQESIKSPYGKPATLGHSRQVLRRQWWDIVQSYSALALSYADDKLPALSGIAKRMAAQRPGSTYLAGLWSDSLELDLLWLNRDSINSKRPFDARPDVWRAPTWSWASIDSRIEFPFKNFTEAEPIEIHFKTAHATCKAATEDQTGKVAEGSVTVEGLATLADITVAEGTTTGADEQPKPSVRLKIGSTTFSSDIDSVEDRLYMDNPADPLGLGQPPSKEHQGEAQVLCMLLATRDGEHSKTQLSMVLRRRRSDSSYERIGMLYQWREFTRRNNPDALDNLLVAAAQEYEPLIETLAKEFWRVKIL